MKSIDFNDTETAFAYRGKLDLIMAYNMFYLMKYNWLVKLGTDVTMKAWDRGVRFPISIAMKPTVYRQFCGGESLERSTKRIEQLYKYDVQVILDYGMEAKDNDADFDKTAAEVRKAILFAYEQESVPIVCSKFTGLIRFRILEKLHVGEPLTEDEQRSYDRSKERIDALCKLACEKNVGLFIDAEETWLQKPVDDLAHEMMARYNKETAIVYNTIQLYLKHRLADFKLFSDQAKKEGYIYGAKLVRGAYMDKESERARQKGYDNPIQPDKETTDRDYNLALRYAMANLAHISICVATHNEESCLLAADLMEKAGIDPGDNRVYFSQLYGMSDHISFNLVKGGYHVAKYMPYGPVTDVVPYLVRRAQENTSVAGQMGRELSLLRQEMKRRKLLF